MKIIDLLNKISNGEDLPEKIYCFNREFYLKGNTYYGDTFTLMHYIQEEDLNDEVEILEEEKKIPEKLDDRARFQYSEIPTWLEKKEIIKVINENFEKHQKAIYELIDYLKSKGE